jgi:hypothetical protein
MMVRCETILSLFNNILKKHIICILYQYKQDIGWDIYNIEKEFKRQGVLKQWINEAGVKIPCPWKLSMANYDFKVCSSYPELIVVPSELTDDNVMEVGSFRSEGRMPALCWGYANSAGSIWRASQPKVGVQGNTSKADEQLLYLVASSVNHKLKHASSSSSNGRNDGDGSEVDSSVPMGVTTSDPVFLHSPANSFSGASTSFRSQSGSSSAAPSSSQRSASPPRPISGARSISTALHSTFLSSSNRSKSQTMSQSEKFSDVSSSNPPFTSPDMLPNVVHIIDCRPYTSAKANLLNGYGVESVTNYPGAKISFMDMENIHSIRDSYNKLEKACLFYNNSLHLNNNKEITWGATVEGTKWLQHMRLFLSCSLQVANIVHNLRQPVLVHCRYPSMYTHLPIFYDAYF